MHIDIRPARKDILRVENCPRIVHNSEAMVFFRAPSSQSGLVIFWFNVAAEKKLGIDG